MLEFNVYDIVVKFINKFEFNLNDIVLKFVSKFICLFFMIFNQLNV